MMSNDDNDGGMDEDSKTMLWIGGFILAAAVLFTIYMMVFGTDGLIP